MVLRLADTSAGEPLLDDDAVARRARAIVQHEQVMQEAAAIARAAEQARNRAASVPVFGDASHSPESARSRVVWVTDRQRAS